MVFHIVWLATSGCFFSFEDIYFYGVISVNIHVLVSRTNLATELSFKKKCYSIYLDVTIFHLTILDVLPEVVADGSKGGMHLYAEITSESNRSFIQSAFLFIWEKKNILYTQCPLQK